jgi:hypothetical protein
MIVFVSSSRFTPTVTYYESNSWHHYCSTRIFSILSKLLYLLGEWLYLVALGHHLPTVPSVRLAAEETP